MGDNGKELILEALIQQNLDEIQEVRHLMRDIELRQNKILDIQNGRIDYTPNKEYLSLKYLMVEILKEEGIPMHWEELYDEVLIYKETTKKNSVRSLLSQMASSDKFPISKVGVGAFIYHG